jgi:site-specific recombinase XerD
VPAICPRLLIAVAVKLVSGAPEPLLPQVPRATRLPLSSSLHGSDLRRSSGTPASRITPLIDGARPLLEWFVTDVRGQFDDRWDQPGAPLLCSERNTTDGDACRVSAETLRAGLAQAVTRHLPAWRGRLSPHVLRHHCASSLYRDGVDIVAIQELLGHEWIATTMGYVNPRELHQTGEKRQVA